MSVTDCPALFVSHGGGPWPWMEGPMREGHRGLEGALRRMPALLGSPPRAVLVVTAHWEEREFAFSAHPAPPMIYDYGGFPEHTYRVQYPAPGAPDLAARAQRLLAGTGIDSRLDPARGYDHGSFVPMHVMYPAADVPLLQMSLRRGLDPAEHLAAGRALAPLRGEGVLIVGSGSSYHNLGMLGEASAAPSALFDGWLQRVLLELTPAQRSAALVDWKSAPAASAAHPREEHLLPLMVAVGSAEQQPGACVHRETKMFGFATVSNFCFGAPHAR